MERILPPARGVSSIGSTVGDAVVPVAESPPNLPLQAALVNDLCSVQNGSLAQSKLGCVSGRVSRITTFKLPADMVIAVGYGKTQLKNTAARFAGENRRVRIVNTEVK